MRIDPSTSKTLTDRLPTEAQKVSRVAPLTDDSAGSSPKPPPMVDDGRVDLQTNPRSIATGPDIAKPVAIDTTRLSRLRFHVISSIRLSTDWIQRAVFRMDPAETQVFKPTASGDPTRPREPEDGSPRSVREDRRTTKTVTQTTTGIADQTTTQARVVETAANGLERVRAVRVDEQTDPQPNDPDRPA